MERKRLIKEVNRLLLPGMILLALVTGFSSCSKSGDCFKGTGNVIKETRIVSDFDTLVAGENIDIILTQDTVNSVVVEAGEKIISGITTKVTDRQLEIGNTNSCNWVRSYDKPLNVYVHVKNLRKIYYLSAGNISTTNTLTPESFMLDVWGGCGSIALTLNVNTGYIYEHLGTADITISGKVLINSVVASDFGFLQLKDLQSDYCYVSNTGTNDCYVNVTKYLDAKIRSIGNIYYTGKPDTVNCYISGTGQLIEF